VTANEKRTAVIKKYEVLLGRNKYSQPKRDYCYKKYKDGKYYSDCSSSISYAYKEAGYSFGILNTVGMIQSTKLKDVPVIIKYGQIQNPEILRPGDLLLFAGTDTSRAAADYVGHVEMVAKISGSKVTIYGHGSGNPRSTDMKTYCTSRYNSKTKTKLGNKGLIRVRRFIQDDAAPDTATTASGNKVKITGNSVNVRSGPGTNFPVLDVAKLGDTYPAVNIEDWNAVDMGSMIGWTSKKYSEEVKG
jgi:hypothetical protein